MSSLIRACWLISAVFRNLCCILHILNIPGYRDDDQVFLTDDGIAAEYIGTRHSEAMTIGSCTEEETLGRESCVTDIQNSDGEMFYDGVFTDDEESAEENEVDYETDLEVDEESKLRLNYFCAEDLKCSMLVSATTSILMVLKYQNS